MRRNLAPDTVLVIDDDADFRGLVTAIGELYGIRVLEAADCHSGLKLLGREHGRIKLVVLDYLMPGMDPSTCAAAIITKAGPQVPVVLVTAAANPAARARQLQLDQWIPKPIELSTLTDLLIQSRSS